MFKNYFVIVFFYLIFFSCSISSEEFLGSTNSINIINTNTNINIVIWSTNLVESITNNNVDDYKYIFVSNYQKVMNAVEVGYAWGSNSQYIYQEGYRWTAYFRYYANCVVSNLIHPVTNKYNIYTNLVYIDSFILLTNYLWEFESYGSIYFSNKIVSLTTHTQINLYDRTQSNIQIVPRLDSNTIWYYVP